MGTADSDALRALRKTAIPFLSKEEEVELLTLWNERRDQNARDRLVRSHVLLVMSIAKQFRFYGIPLDDLTATGIIGMCKAIDGFDLSHGTRLNTYAMHWIRAELQNYVLRNWSVVRGGTSHKNRDLFFRLRKAYAEEMKKVSGPTTKREIVEKISRMMSIQVDAVESLFFRFSAPDISLDAPLVDDGSASSTVADSIPDEADGQDVVVQGLIDGERRTDALRAALAKLSDRERAIIEARYLKDDTDTLSEVAPQFGISRERVRQIEFKALAKLRELLAGDHQAEVLT